MLLTLIIWIIVGYAALGYGRIFFTSRRHNDNATSGLNPECLAVRLYLGLLFLVCVLATAAIFIPVRWWVGLIAVLPGLALSVSEYRQHGKHSAPLLWPVKSIPTLAILACMALFVSSREVNFYDTALYHQQAAKWLSDYGLVTGLALIHVRYGSPSSWFAGAAALNHGFLTAREVPIMGGMCFALLGATSFLALWRMAQGRLSVNLRTVTWVTFSGMLLTVSVLLNVEASLSPDLVVWLASPVIALLATDPHSDSSDRAGRSLLASLFACTVKLTALPFVLCSSALCAWSFIRNPKLRGKLLKYGVVAAFVFTLLLGSSFKASGCPLFPSTVGCSSANFSVGGAVAAQTAAGIRQFANHGSRQTLPLFLGAILAGLVLVLMSPTSEFVYHGLGASFCGILFVVATAPNPRFGMGYFLFPLALALAAILCRTAPYWADVLRKRGIYVQAVLALSPLAICAASLFQMASVGELLIPQKMASTNGDAIHILNRRVNVRTTLSLSQRQVGSLAIWQPESTDQCWDAPLPCTPGLTLGGAKLRDSSQGFKAGFETKMGPSSSGSN